MDTKHKVAIIGSGPAGLTAAIYSARARLHPILFAGVEFGGQLMTTSKVENYPGFPDGIDGPKLMQAMITQAERFDTTIKYEFVDSVDFQNQPFKLKTNKEEYLADSVIIAVGSSPRKIGIESEQKFWGKGVSTCATCDGPLFRNKVVAVIGGGDSAMEEASFLAQHASKVYIIHRRNEFRASKIMQERIFHHPKIEVIWNSEIKDVLGTQVVSGLKLVNNQTGTESEIDASGVFLAIGHIPQTEFLKGQLDLRQNGYIQSHDSVHTSVDGVFVAGDVEDWVYQQAITAAGAGCKAALEAQRWLESIHTSL